MPDGNTNTGTGAGQQNQGNQQGQQNSETPFTYDTWLAQQPEDVRTGIEAHITGLRNTVQATRQERDALSGRLTELTNALGKDTPEEAKRLLAEMTSELETTNKRAAFYEGAGNPEVGCTNPRAAFLLAQADQLYDRRGNPDWAAIKAAAPELFRQAGQQKGSADGGAGGDNKPTGNSMNDFIRKAARR